MTASEFLAPSAPANAIKAYERALGAVRDLHRVTAAEFRAFADRLSSASDPDSYLTSPTYYAITARHGLWVYETASDFIPIGWHPNVPGQLLAFPIAGHHEGLGQLITSLPPPPNGLRVARVKNVRAQWLFATQIPAATTCHIAIPHPEPVLDWTFPIRLLSTHRVAAMEGSAFRYVRNHYKQIALTQHRIEPLAKDHHAEIRAFVSRWAASKDPDREQQAQRCNPYDIMLDLAAADAPVGGFVTLMDKQIVGFSLWDISNGASGPVANRYANLTIGQRGLAEFQTVIMCQLLRDQGIANVNVGGAETSGLDRFKAKFHPVHSVPACSVTVLPGRVSYEPAPRNAAGYLLPFATEGPHFA